MSSVWYVAAADRRVIRTADWDAAGTDDGGDYTWGPANGYSYPTSAFTVEQLAYLDSLNTEFWVGAPDGPRTVVVPDPVGYVTEVRVREIVATTPVFGLTAAAVGLGHVDDTADVDKPVSGPQAAALAGYLPRPGGGTTGQVLTYTSGGEAVWSPPAGSTAIAVTRVQDPDMPSGYRYRVTGSGIAEHPDPDVPSGVTYSIVESSTVTGDVSVQDNGDGSWTAAAFTDNGDGTWTGNVTDNGDGTWTG